MKTGSFFLEFQEEACAFQDCLMLNSHVIHFVWSMLFYIYLLLINLSFESRH